MSSYTPEEQDEINDLLGVAAVHTNISTSRSTPIVDSPVIKTENPSQGGQTATPILPVKQEPELEYHGNSRYAGDIIDKTPLLESKYKTLDFINSAQLIAAFDDRITAQQSLDSVTLHPWQLDIARELCQPEQKPTSQHPLKYCLVASNGSGKDAFVTGPFAIWFCLTKVLARVIITSSSGGQLATQTEYHIKTLTEKINEKFGCEVFRIRQRYIKCRWSGSEIRLFATDEAGKAEGYHPLEPGREMAIIINEWKSVPEEITMALGRCSGFNYWLGVSSPGEPMGDLYYAFNNYKHSRRVTSFDCPHISEAEIEEDRKRYGEHSAYYRSKHLALFTQLGGEVIIPLDLVNRLLTNPPQLLFKTSKFQQLRIGIDLSAGGDETTVCITRGNKIFKEYQSREADTTVTAGWIHSRLMQHEIQKTHEFIFADDGGVGHAIIDMLVRMGWNIKRIHNQSPAIYKLHYGNRGAEAWDRVKRLFEESIWDPTGMSKETIEQLTNRKVKDKLVGAKQYLQSKKEAKSHGFKSPDRADALILSLTGLSLDDFLQDAKVIEGPIKRRGITLANPAEVEAHYDNTVTYANYDNLTNTTKNKKCYGSLSKIAAQEGFDPYDT